MESKSIFLKIEGDKPVNRIWNFLLVYAEYDYSLKDISENAEVSYAMTKILFRDYFVPRKLVKERAVGNAKLYHLDFDNPVVEKFNEYYLAVVEANTPELKDRKREKIIEVMN